MYLPLGESSEDIRVGRAGARRPAFGPVVLALFGLVVAAGVFLPQGAWATFTYQETDTAGTNNAFSCDGTTLSSAGRANLQMIQGGTAGTTGNTVTLGAFENSIGYSLISPSNDPNLVSWQNGNWVVRLDVTTADPSASLSWDGTCIFRVDSAGTTNLATVGSLTGQSDSLAGTGVHTMTVSGASQSAGSTDRIYIEFVFQNTDSSSHSFGFKSDSTVGTPLSGGGSSTSTTGTKAVTSRSDILSDPRPSATSNHTIAFTIHNSLDTTGWGSGSGGDATDTLSIAFPSSVNLSNVNCKDVDLSFGGVATSVAGYFPSRSTSQDCPGSATSWGLFINPTASSITFYTPTSLATYVATGTQVQVLIGTNASFQDAATKWITNPSSAGIYTISVGGTFGGSGNMLVSINSGVTVAATVAESLALTASSVNAVNCTADDGATVNSVTSTATSVPFGIISPNTFYQGCQDLIVSTNAGNGYSLAVQESSVMKTVNGQFTIPDTTCDAGGCTESAAAAWATATHNGFGHTCANQLNHDCNAAYSSGMNFRQAADLSQGETAQSVMSSSTAATATGRMKYRLSAGNAQAAGTYTTLITYTIYAAY